MACVASLTLTSALAFGVGARKSVALTVNGETTTVTTYAMSVDRLLQEQGVKVKTHDLVESTSPTSMLKNHDVVNVQSAYQTTITIDGQPVWENAALKARIASIPDDWYYFNTASIRDMTRFYRGCLLYTSPSPRDS